MRQILVTAALAVGLLVIALLIVRPYLSSKAPADAKTDAGGGEVTSVDVSESAQKTLGLTSQQVKLEKFWKKLPVPGMIVDRPGVSDRGVVAQITGVVGRIHASPGDTIRPGEPLFEVRITSELLLNTQAELYKVTQDAALQEKTVARLEASRASIPASQIAEAKAVQTKLAAQSRVFRQLLQAQGLTPVQIDAVTEGRFVRQMTVVAPGANGTMVSAGSSSFSEEIAYELQDLKAQLGEQVQAGQVLAILANHRLLFIEGRAFKSEMPQVEVAAKNNWPIEVEFPVGEGSGWATLNRKFEIRSLGNVVDPISRTVPFMLPIENEARTYRRDGKTYIAWRFRPGQRVRLHVPVEEMKDVIVLPLDAVVREGVESFVFRQNGDSFDRKPVVVLYQDRRQVVIGKESLPLGVYVASNNGAALNRALKAKAAGGGEGHHHHHH